MERFDHFRGFGITVALRMVSLALLVSFGLMACRQDEDSQSVPFVVATSEEQFLQAMSSRYQIEAWEGYGIPDGPTSDVKLENARLVLQTIIEECTLGVSTLIEATGGVIILHPETDQLNPAQALCVQSFEQPGLIFRDTKAI